MILANRKIPRILWKPKIQYLIHKNQWTVPINPVHAPIPILEDPL